MKRQIPRLGPTALVAVCVLISACTTPPQSPSSPPPVQPPREPPPQTEPREQQDQTSQAAGAETQPDPSSAEAQQTSGGEAAPTARTAPPDAAETPPAGPPPSADSPDVEITDIPLDEDGNPIIEPAAQQQSAAQSTPPASAGGGGAPTPAGGRDASTGANAGSKVPAAANVTAPAINVGTAATATERSATLEQDLKAKLAEFDELMRKAREEAERENSGGGGTAATGGAMAGAAGGSGGRREPGDGTGEGGQAARSSGLGHTPDHTGTNQPGEYRQATGPIPNDVPDARDDDIVARQLREAATRESDPVLREKLWQEYRKYKSGIGR